jgi:hypothetical protein
LHRAVLMALGEETTMTSSAATASLGKPPPSSVFNVSRRRSQPKLTFPSESQSAPTGDQGSTGLAYRFSFIISDWFNEASGNGAVNDGLSMVINICSIMGMMLPDNKRAPYSRRPTLMSVRY